MQQKTICESGASKNAEKKIEEKMANSDETAEIRNKAKDANQKQPTARPTKGSRANKTEIEVATPLPPLNLR